MFEWLGRVAVKRRILILLLTAMAVTVAVLLGSGAADRLAGGGFSDPGSESTRASDLLLKRFHTGEPNLVLVVTAPVGGSVDDPANARSGAALTDRLRREAGVAEVSSYWSLGNAKPLRTSDGRSALVLARVSGNDDTAKRAISGFVDRYRAEGKLTIRSAGSTEVSREMTEILKDDLVRAESYALPLTLALLLFVFAGVVAATLPLVVGLVAVTATMALLWLLAEVTDVSVFALNVTTALGLGLAIDYSLFVVTRFREELARGTAPDAAVRETVRTAGRTVVYSAMVVSLSMAALLVFPLYFLRSIAYAGIAVVLLAAASAVVVLPAVLAVLGHRVNRFSLRRRRAPAKHAPAVAPFWERVARAVMKRPLRWSVPVMALLLCAGAPFLHAKFGLPDDRVLPASAVSRESGDILRNDFASREAAPLFVVSDQGLDAPAIDAYARRLSRVEGVSRIDASTGSYRDGVQFAPPTLLSARYTDGTGMWLSVVPEVDTYSTAGQELVLAVRAVPLPVPVLVGGQSALLVDTNAAIAARMPVALGIIAVSVGILLFLFTGSVLIPIKALVLNVLSLSATFGLMVWVFQEGHLRWLVGDFAVTDRLDTTMPVLMFCVAFGLSMDYEVFLLSRIHEEWRATGNNNTAVARGLGRTGRLVTAAAALVSVVFLSFATSGVTSLKMLGVGLALAVIVDATLVRGVLVPAFMGLAGRANWWAPAPLRALHRLLGLSEPSSTGQGTPSVGVSGAKQEAGPPMGAMVADQALDDTSHTVIDFQTRHVRSGT